MNFQQIFKCNLILVFLNLSAAMQASSFQGSPDTRDSAIIGSEGGSMILEDSDTGMTVGLYIPEGALLKETEITLVIHGTSQPGVLAKCNLNGISLFPESLLFMEKVRLEIYNPPPLMEVTELMILYRVVNSGFIIPLGDIEHHPDEGWISGTLYSAGRFSLGTPDSDEMAIQCKKLASYNPSLPLAFSKADPDNPCMPDHSNESSQFHPGGGPSFRYEEISGLKNFMVVTDNDDCLRWQKALTTVEAHLTWVEQYRYTGNTEGEEKEKASAEKVLQDAIDNYLAKARPVNQCGSYIKAAAKYLESATRLGMNVGNETGIARHFNNLVNSCSFVFTLEELYWTNHPKEKNRDGSTFEERSRMYTLLKCHTPWNEFLTTGIQKVRGEGECAVTMENHWVGEEKEDHLSTSGDWKVEKIEGGIQQYIDEHGEQSMLANISIYWKKNSTTHIWGKNPQGSYDESGSSSESYMESKSFPIVNGYFERIGNENGGHSIRVSIISAPGYKHDDPNDCF